MQAVVLVGGLGTRLRPLTFSLPKPLLPVGEHPLLQLLLEQLHASGMRDVVLATLEFAHRARVATRRRRPRVTLRRSLVPSGSPTF